MLICIHVSVCLVWFGLVWFGFELFVWDCGGLV